MCVRDLSSSIFPSLFTWGFGQFCDLCWLETALEVHYEANDLSVHYNDFLLHEYSPIYVGVFLQTAQVFMATKLQKSVDSPSSSDTEIAKAKQNVVMEEDAACYTKDESHDNIEYPPPWKWERYFIGGYTSSRMFKFKKPKTMYTAINLFAGVAIMFYGYDQGVMSQVNLNEDYWNHMGINPIEGNQRNTAALGGIVSVYYGGTLIGALIAGSLADRAGRIKAVVFGSMWALLGAVLRLPHRTSRGCAALELLLGLV